MPHQEEVKERGADLRRHRRRTVPFLSATPKAKREWAGDGATTTTPATDSPNNSGKATKPAIGFSTRRDECTCKLIEQHEHTHIKKKRRKAGQHHTLTPGLLRLVLRLACLGCLGGAWLSLGPPPRIPTRKHIYNTSRRGVPCGLCQVLSGEAVWRVMDVVGGWKTGIALV